MPQFSPDDRTVIKFMKKKIQYQMGCYLVTDFRDIWCWT